MLPRKGRRVAALLAAESILSGMLEAVLLVLIVSVALSVASTGSAVSFELPVLGLLEVDAGMALLVAAVAGLGMLALHTHFAHLGSELAAGVLQAARDRAANSFAAATWERQADDREGALQETVSTLALQTSALVGSLTIFASGSMGLVALLLAAVMVDAIVTVVVLSFGLMLFLILRPVGRLTRARSRDYVARNSHLTEQMGQWSALAMELRVFGVEHIEARRLSEENRSTSQALRRARFISRMGTELYRDLAILFLVGAVAGLYLIGNVDLAAVGAVVLLIVRSLAYAQMTNSAVQSVNELSPNLNALMARIESLEASAEQVGHRRLDAVTRLELRRVDYDYGFGRRGIKNITVDIANGEVLGVIGPSGGGKSTLVQVLLRLRPPTQGSITVSGIPYQDIDPQCWHRLVTLVPQEPKLFEGTIADNIAFFRCGISRQRLEQAARAANILEDIRQLPDGFDTELGPRGAGLSGGQRQRIAIARALVGDPQLIVLDEPTSALDVRSEQLLQHTIAELKGRVTLVIVAHRLTTLACCDRVVAMENGQVKVIGSLDEALAQVSFDDQQLINIGDLGSEPSAS